MPRIRADAFFRASALAFAASWPPLMVRRIVPARSCDSKPEMERWMSATSMPPSTLFRWLAWALLRASNRGGLSRDVLRQCVVPWGCHRHCT